MHKNITLLTQKYESILSISVERDTVGKKSFYISMNSITFVVMLNKIKLCANLYNLKFVLELCGAFLGV